MRWSVRGSQGVCIGGVGFRWVDMAAFAHAGHPSSPSSLPPTGPPSPSPSAPQSPFPPPSRSPSPSPPSAPPRPHPPSPPGYSLLHIQTGQLPWRFQETFPRLGGGMWSGQQLNAWADIKQQAVNDLHHSVRHININNNVKVIISSSSTSSSSSAAASLWRTVRQTFYSHPCSTPQNQGAHHLVAHLVLLNPRHAACHGVRHPLIFPQAELIPLSCFQTHPHRLWCLLGGTPLLLHPQHASSCHPALSPFFTN